MKLSISSVGRRTGVLLILIAVAVPLIVSARGEKKSRPLANVGPALAAAPGPEVGEGESLLSLETYMSDRVTYPTGRFDARWLQKAARQDRLVPRGAPAGATRSATAADGTNRSMALSTSSFTELGPKPLLSSGCQAPCFTFGAVSGRVNAIEVEPPSVTQLNGTRTAYIGVDGGGIWKSTNCCTAATSWTVTTDGPTISTTSIDDIAIDPNNPATVYAATGDISFGSFAFGASGILKSTDRGGTWQSLATGVFVPNYNAYPAPPPATYPQYQAVSKVEVDPNTSNTVIAGTKTGLFFSYDAGVNWTGPCYTNSFTGQRQDITDLILADNGTAAVLNEGTTVYAAVGARGFATTVQPNLGLNGANGIYKATVPASGCPTWQLITTAANGWPSGTGEGVGCDPPIGDSTTLCTAAQDKLGRIEMAIAPSTLNDGIAGNEVLYAEVQAVDPQTPCGVLQILGDTTARGCFLGLWRTGDSGATWVQKANQAELGNPVTAGACIDDTPQNWYNQGVAVDPLFPDVLFMDTIDVWKSTNGGDTLVNVTCGYQTGLAFAPVHVDNHSLEYVPGDNTTLLAGNDGGIYVSNDAASAPLPATPVLPGVPTFAPTNETVSTIEFYSGDISQNFATAAPKFAVAGAQDNGSSTSEWATNGSEGPQPWSQRIGGDGMYARIEPQQGQRVFMESQNGNLQRSTTGPAGPYTGWAGGWTADARKSFVFPYEIDKNDCKTFARVVEATCKHMIAGSFRVWETIDNAAASTSWLSKSGDLTKCGGMNPCTTGLRDRAFINQLAYAWSDNRVAIAGTNDGNVQYGFNMGQAVANTATWVNVTGAQTGGATELPNRPIQDVTIAPDNPLVGYAAVGGFNANAAPAGHVFQVTCTASCASFSWANKSGNLPDIPVNSIIANPKAPNQVYAGTDWGVYFTNNISLGTPVWTRFQTGLPNVMIWDMAVDRGATTLAVFTRSRGAFATLLPSGTTAVTIASFSARASTRSVTLRWRTASELDILGFNVWRFRNGKGVQVNRSLVPAKVGGAAGGATYRLRDSSVRTGVTYRYRLQVVNRDSARSWRASTAVRVSR